MNQSIKTNRKCVERQKSFDRSRLIKRAGIELQSRRPTEVSRVNDCDNGVLKQGLSLHSCTASTWEAQTAPLTGDAIAW